MGRHKGVNEHLPPRMVLRHGGYYRTPRIDGRQVMQHLGNDYQAALDAYYNLEGTARPTKPGWEGAIEEPQTGNWKRALFHSVKSRSKRLDIEFSMTFPELLQLMVIADGRCQITKIPFDFRFQTARRPRPWAPSLDRINPQKGYAFDNCRLVCTAVNFAMNEWGLDVLLKIGQALKEQRLI